MFIIALFPAAIYAQSQLAFDVIDSIDWRDGQTSVAGVTETYSYDPGSDTVTVNVAFDSNSPLAPLPPMLALAHKYGLPLSFNKPVIETDSYSILGPLMGVRNTDTYSWQISGLGRYVSGQRNHGSGLEPAWMLPELEQKVADILAAGHLAPWIVLKNVPGAGASDRGAVYFNHPGENLYFLAEVADLLKPTLQQQLRTYMQNERNAYRPEDTYSMPWTQGTPRPYFSPPDSVINGLASDELRWRNQGDPRIWNLYGLARYYEFLEDTPTQQVVDDCTALVNDQLDYRDWASLYWTEGHSPHFNAVHGVNQTFAGLIGYIRIARMAGDTDAEALGWGLLARMAVLRFAMGKYTQYEYDYGYFAIPTPLDPEWWARELLGAWQGTLTSFNWTRPIDNVRQIHWLSDTKVATWEHADGGFASDGQKSPSDDPYWINSSTGVRVAESQYYLPMADVVFELGLFLKDHLADEIQAYCDRIAENQPHWDCAYAEALLGAEVGFHMPCDSYGIFCAHAWVLEDSPKQLNSHLDVSWLKLGDFFYMHKLAETIRAYRNYVEDVIPPTPDPLT